MFELLITILLSFGMSTTPVNGKLQVNSAVTSAAKSASDYTVKGGDAALNSIAIPDEVDPKSAN